MSWKFLAITPKQQQKEKEIEMENQHRKIKGYRELNQEEIDLMNEIKTKGAEFGELIEKVNKTNNHLTQTGALSSDNFGDCFRWSSIAKTDLQTGLMALTRAVAKPDFF